MESRIIEKAVEIEGHRYVIRKYTAMTGIKLAKLFIAKLLPLFQGFMPLLIDAVKNKTQGASVPLPTELFDRLDEMLSLDQIAETLDKMSEEDLEAVVHQSLMCVSEVLPAGNSPVMRPDGSYGVEGVEYDPLLTIRLVVEAVRWGLGDFFSANRWNSILARPQIS